MLSKIPQDIFSDIAQFLDPRDLVKLSRVSKGLETHISNSRSLWFDQVQNLILKECITPSSFSPSSLSLEALRALATRPDRFLSAIGKPPASILIRPEASLSPRRYAYLPDVGIRTPLEFQMLLPGGRWLLTANGTDYASQLCCWDLDDLNRLPSVHLLRKRLAVFDDLESSPIVTAQSDPNNKRVLLMVRTCNDDGEYDVDIIYLSWTSVTSTGEGGPIFSRAARLIPGNVYVEEAVLEGEMVCIGSATNWLVWNWREDTIAHLHLKDVVGSNVMHIILRPPHLLTVSSAGFISVYEIPPLTAVSFAEPVKYMYEPLASSASYGTIRVAKTMQDWLPLPLRSPPLVCLKATVIPAFAGSPDSSSNFANPMLLLDYSYTPPASGIEDTPQNLLPRLYYRKRGSLNWSPSYAICCGVLVELTFTAQRRRISNSWRLLPTFTSECHYLAKDWDTLNSRRWQNPAPGILVLESSIEESLNTSREDISGRSQWVSVDFTVGRVVMLRPRTRGMEVFDFH